MCLILGRLLVTVLIIERAGNLHSNVVMVTLVFSWLLCRKTLIALNKGGECGSLAFFRTHWITVLCRVQNCVQIERNVRVRTARQKVGRWRNCESEPNQDRKVSFRSSSRRSRCFENIIVDKSTKDYILLSFQNLFVRFLLMVFCLLATRALLLAFRAVYPRPAPFTFFPRCVPTTRN